MAHWLTPIRTAGLAIATGLLLGLAVGQASVVPTAPGGYTPRRPEARARTLLEWRARAAMVAWETASMVDSVRQSGVVPGIALAPDIPQSLRDQITNAVEQLPVVGHGPGMAVVAVADPLAVATYRTAAVTFALPRTDAEPCLALVRLGRALLDGDRGVGNMAFALGNRLPGVCGFAVEFGRPGPAVAEWLGVSNGRFALDADPRRSRRTLDDVPAYSLAALGSSLRGADRAYLGCVRRNESACRAWLGREITDYLLPPLPPKQRREMAAAVGPVTTVGVATWPGYPRPDVSGRFLADLLAAEGHDAFRAFWTSPLEFDSAFASAFGQSAGAWVADWFRAVNMPVPRELRPTRRAVPGGLLLLVVVLGGTLLYTARRTVAT